MLDFQACCNLETSLDNCEISRSDINKMEEINELLKLNWFIETRTHDLSQIRVITIFNGIYFIYNL